MRPFDLEPPAKALAALLPRVRDGQLDSRTPCPDYRVRDLLFHLLGLSTAFGAAAHKDLGEATSTSPQEMETDLPPDRRIQLPQRLGELVAAWRDPAAWEGQTLAGGVGYLPKSPARSRPTS